MALYELDEFQGPQFLGFVRNLPTPYPFLGETWLPNQPTFDLSFDYILGAYNRPVMATVMGWDAEAPIAGRIPFGPKVTGELPPVKRKARISEKEIIRFLTPRAGTPDLQNAIDSVYNLSAQLIDSVQARVEWLRMQALSELTMVVNEGGAVFNFDFGKTPGLFYDLVAGVDGAGVPITNAATVGGAAGGPLDGSGGAPNPATPVQFLQSICNRMQFTYGFRPVELVCSRKVLYMLLNDPSIRQLIRGSNAPAAILARAELDTLFALYDLPQLTVYDASANQENADGSLSQIRMMAENKCFLLPPPEIELGQTLWGPTAESRVLLGTGLAGQAPGVFASTYVTTDPPSEWVKAAATAFPTLPGANLLASAKLY